MPVIQPFGSYARRDLTFALGNERYGIDIKCVQEIISVPAITPVPRAPTGIRGVVNLRGRIIPVAELRVMLGFDEGQYDEKSCIVIVSIQTGEEHHLVGILVDRVLEVIDLAPEELEGCPNFGNEPHQRVLLGIGKKPNQPICIILDIERLLGDEISVLNAK